MALWQRLHVHPALALPQYCCSEAYFHPSHALHPAAEMPQELACDQALHLVQSHSRQLPQTRQLGLRLACEVRLLEEGVLLMLHVYQPLLQLAAKE